MFEGKNTDVWVHWELSIFSFQTLGSTIFDNVIYLSDYSTELMVIMVLLCVVVPSLTCSLFSVQETMWGAGRRRGDQP